MITEIGKYFLIVWIVLLGIQINLVNCKSKIAIIGAGISGTSCALFLKDLLGTKVEIHIYEQNKIGGRIVSIQDEDRIYEVGVPVFSDSDKYVLQLVKRFGLKTISTNRKPFATYKQGHLNSPNLLNRVKMTGSLYKIFNFTNTVTDLLETIYEKQLKKKSFLTINSILDIISIGRLRLIDCDDFDIDINEIFKASIISTYGGNLEEIPAMAAWVPLHMYDLVFRIQGGNVLLAEKCSTESGAELHMEKVIKLERMINNLWKVKSIKGKDKFERNFDYVVIAAPMAENFKKMKFQNSPYLEPVIGKFKEKVITILEGNLKPESFITNSNVANYANTIFFLDTSPTNKINMMSRVYEKPNIWRIQSDIILPDVDFQELIDVKRAIKVVKFPGYPDYSTCEPGDHERFIFTKNVFYINCIEWAASSVEMSLIGAKNVAILIYKTGKFNRLP